MRSSMLEIIHIGLLRTGSDEMAAERPLPASVFLPNIKLRNAIRPVILDISQALV